MDRSYRFLVQMLFCKMQDQISAEYEHMKINTALEQPQHSSSPSSAESAHSMSMSVESRGDDRERGEEQGEAMGRDEDGEILPHLKCDLLAMSDLVLDKDPLAVGGYAEVFRGTWLKQNMVVAVKRLFRASEKPGRTAGSKGRDRHQDIVEDFSREVNIMYGLDHPHIVRLFGAVVEEDSMCIVTEFVPRGSLFDLIHSKAPVSFKPETVRVLAKQICAGMGFLHARGIMHRDLKPGNLLLGTAVTPTGPQLSVKIADFGLSRAALPSLASSLSLHSASSSAETAETALSECETLPELVWEEEEEGITGAVGTAQYTAPEVLRKAAYNGKADVWSFGVVLWEIFERRVPFCGMTNEEVRVEVGEKGHRLRRPQHCNEEFWGVMEQCWRGGPGERPSFAELEERFA